MFLIQNMRIADAYELAAINDPSDTSFVWRNIPFKSQSVWRNIPFKIQSGYFPYRKINFRVGNQLTGSVIVGLFQTSSLSAISRV